MNAVLLASVSVIQGVFGSGWYNIGSLMSVSFAILNALLHSSIHSNFMFFFSTFWMGCIRSENAGMNLQ